MAIRIRLRELLDARDIKQTELQLRTGLAYSTVNDLYHGKTKRIELDTLDVLCRTLNCDVSDLLEYVGDEKRARR